MDSVRADISAKGSARPTSGSGQTVSLGLCVPHLIPLSHASEHVRLVRRDAQQCELSGTLGTPESGGQLASLARTESIELPQI